MSINNLACSKYKNKKFKDSIEYFFEAIKKDPDIDVIIRTNMDAILNPAKGGCDLFGFWIGDLIKNGIFSRSIFKTVLAASVIILMILNIFIIMFPSYIHSGDTFDGIHYVENTTESTYSVPSEEIGLKTAQTNNAGDKEFKNDQLILSAKKVTEKVSINLEYRMILVGIGIIIILLPWIKSFKAGNLEIEIKDSLSIVTGGAGDPKALLIEA